MGERSISLIRDSLWGEMVDAQIVDVEHSIVNCDKR